MLDLWRLRILETLESLGTMTAAGQALSLTPSAVSQQMAILEREAGVTLLHRSGRRVRLSDAGRELAQHARGILQAVEDAESSMNTRRTDISGSVRVAAFPTFAATFLPRTLTKLALAFPRLSLQVCDLEPLEAMSEMRSGRIDLALIDDLTPGHDKVDPTFRKAPLYSDELQICLPAAYREPGRPSIDLADLRDEKWILDGEGTAFATFVLTMCRDAGFEPKVAAYCRSPLVTCAMVAADQGVAILPDLMTSNTAVLRGTFTLPVSPRRTRNIFTIHRRSSESAPELRAVLEEIRASVRDVQREML
jgi:DNA-binding transcriptional LysR family regulator